MPTLASTSTTMSGDTLQSNKVIDILRGFTLSNISSPTPPSIRSSQNSVQSGFDSESFSCGTNAGHFKTRANFRPFCGHLHDLLGNTASVSYNEDLLGRLNDFLLDELNPEACFDDSTKNTLQSFHNCIMSFEEHSTVLGYRASVVNILWRGYLRHALKSIGDDGTLWRNGQQSTLWTLEETNRPPGASDFIAKDAGLVLIKTCLELHPSRLAEFVDDVQNGGVTFELNSDGSITKSGLQTHADVADLVEQVKSSTFNSSVGD